MNLKLRPGRFVKKNRIKEYFLKPDAVVFESEGEPEQLTLSQIRKTFALPLSKDLPKAPIIINVDDNRSLSHSELPQSVLLGEEFLKRGPKQKR